MGLTQQGHAVDRQRAREGGQEPVVKFLKVSAVARQAEVIPSFVSRCGIRLGQCAGGIVRPRIGIANEFVRVATRQRSIGTGIPTQQARLNSHAGDALAFRRHLGARHIVVDAPRMSVGENDVQCIPPPPGLATLLGENSRGNGLDKESGQGISDT